MGGGHVIISHDQEVDHCFLVRKGRSKTHKKQMETFEQQEERGVILSIPGMRKKEMKE